MNAGSAGALRAERECRRAHAAVRVGGGKADRLRAGDRLLARGRRRQRPGDRCDRRGSAVSERQRDVVQRRHGHRIGELAGRRAAVGRAVDVSLEVPSALRKRPHLGVRVATAAVGQLDQAGELLPRGGEAEKGIVARHRRGDDLGVNRLDRHVRRAARHTKRESDLTAAAAVLGDGARLAVAENVVADAPAARAAIRQDRVRVRLEAVGRPTR